MKLLLDTHAFLWFLMGDSRLGEEARTGIVQGESEVLLSTASLWEIAIKVSLGKLRLARPFADLIPAQIDANGFRLLGITLEHVELVSRLPFFHRDPFDRLLAAQALTEKVPVVSRDSALDAYGVRRIW